MGEDPKEPEMDGAAVHLLMSRKMSQCLACGVKGLELHFEVGVC